jgi:hypothetical protein
MGRPDEGPRRYGWVRRGAGILIKNLWEVGNLRRLLGIIYKNRKMKG